MGHMHRAGFGQKLSLSISTVDSPLSYAITDEKGDWFI